MIGYYKTTEDKFSNLRFLTCGHTVSLTLHGDRSVTISYGNRRMTQVFTDLPDVPLWVVTHLYMNKLEIIQPGISIYRHFIFPSHI